MTSVHGRKADVLNAIDKCNLLFHRILFKSSPITAAETLRALLNLP